MDEYVECPFCERENEVSSDYLSEGVLEFTLTCDWCGEPFGVTIEFTEVYTSHDIKEESDHA